MPTYDYLCRVCGNRIEVIHGMSESGPSACERCGGPMRRVLHATGIIFKGSGFYKTDSRASSSSTAPASSSSSSPGGPASGGTPPPQTSAGESGKGASTDKATKPSDTAPPPKPPDAG